MIDAGLLVTSMPFFSALPARVNAALRERARAVSLTPLANLLQPGDAVSGAYFVAEGSIRIFYLDGEGREGTLYRILPGESCIFALNCVFSDMPYPVWAQAEEGGVTLVVVEGATARDLATSDGAFMRAMFDQVSRRLYGLLALLEQSIRLPLEARLARLLLDLAGPNDSIRASQERIASHLGTSREVVSRLLRGLSGHKLLQSTYGEIHILDRDGLIARCG